jgi:DNA repair exonuclease SbcCD ATPase subunit
VHVSAPEVAQGCFKAIHAARKLQNHIAELHERVKNLHEEYQVLTAEKNDILTHNNKSEKEVRRTLAAMEQSAKT